MLKKPVGHFLTSDEYDRLKAENPGAADEIRKLGKKRRNKRKRKSKRRQNVLDQKDQARIGRFAKLTAKPEAVLKRPRTVERAKPCTTPRLAQDESE